MKKVSATGVEAKRKARHLMDDLADMVGWSNRVPVVVLGNQKSGTSAIAGLLAEFTGSTSTLDIYTEIRRQDLISVVTGSLPVCSFVRRHRRSFSRDIVKHPNLTLVYPEIRSCLPEARYVFVIRDPRDNIRSILDRLSLSGDTSRLDPDVWSGLSPAWQRILDGNWMGLESSSPVEALARRWSYVARKYLEDASRLHLCRYEDFLEDKAGEIGRVAEAVGLKPLPTADLRLDYQFQPAGRNRDVAAADFFSSGNLDLIEQVTAAEMEALGYEPSDR